MHGLLSTENQIHHSLLKEIFCPTEVSGNLFLTFASFLVTMQQYSFGVPLAPTNDPQHYHTISNILSASQMTTRSEFSDELCQLLAMTGGRVCNA